MLAFEVEVDGEPMARAGLEDWAVLTLIVSASRGLGRGETDNDSLHLHLGGLTLPDRDGVSHHVRWGEAETSLGIGSQIRLNVIETDAVDAPAQRRPSDQRIQKWPLTDDELRDLRYKEYLELKKEFEADAAG